MMLPLEPSTSDHAEIWQFSAAWLAEAPSVTLPMDKAIAVAKTEHLFKATCFINTQLHSK